MREVLESIERYSFNKLSMPPITTKFYVELKFYRKCLELHPTRFVTLVHRPGAELFLFVRSRLAKFRLYRDDFLNQEIRVHFVKKTLRYLMEREYSSPSTVSCLNDFT